jgi:hypothetical protein
MILRNWASAKLGRRSLASVPTERMVYGNVEQMKNGVTAAVLMIFECKMNVEMRSAIVRRTAMAVQKTVEAVIVHRVKPKRGIAELAGPVH